MSPGSPRREHLATLIEPVVKASGYELEEVKVSPAGRRSLVRVVVDGDEGVGLDDVADVSRAISSVLDDNDCFMGQAPYVLEVTSPGVDRPLTTPRHWRRAVGRLVQIPLDGADTVGRVVSADDAGVTLEQDGDRRAYPYDQVRDARVQVEFNRPEGGGS